MSCLIGPLLFIVGMILGTFAIFVLIPWLFELPSTVTEKRVNKKKSLLHEMADDESYLVKIKKQRFNEDWTVELYCEFLMNEQYNHNSRWSSNQQDAMLFGSNNADYIIDQLEKQFRDYPARFSKATNRQEMADK